MQAYLTLFTSPYICKSVARYKYFVHMHVCHLYSSYRVASLCLHTEINCILCSLSMCPHPKQPWLAVGLTTGKDSLNHLLVYNYETKERLLDIETGIYGPDDTMTLYVLMHT